MKEKKVKIHVILLVLRVLFVLFWVVSIVLCK